MKRRIAAFIADTVVAALTNNFKKLEELGRQILTGQDHLKTAIDTLTSTSVAELTAIKSDIDALKAKQAAGTLTDADLDALAVRVDSVTGAIDGLRQAADAAVAAPEPASGS